MVETKVPRKIRIGFSGLICCDALFNVAGYPPEDSGLPCYNFRWNLGGNASNNSIVFSKLRQWYKTKYGDQTSSEIEIEIMGTMGTDLPSGFLKEIFNKNEIRHDRVIIDSNMKSPITGLFINTLNGSRTFAHFTEHYLDLKFEQYLYYDLMNFDWIHLESRNNVESMISLVRHIAANQSNVNQERKPIISVEMESDRPGLDQLFQEKVDYFFIERDFSSMKGWTSLDETIDQVCKLIKHNAYVIFVWGESGSKIAKVIQGQIIGNISIAPIFPPKGGVVDTCGAGDSYLAATVFDILVRNHSAEEAIIFGSKVAGAKVGMPGYDDLHNWESYISS